MSSSSCIRNEMTKSTKTEEKSCQTDEDLIYNYAWTKFYYHFQSNAGSAKPGSHIAESSASALGGHQSTQQKQQQQQKQNQVQTMQQDARLDSEAIKRIAQENLEARGFLYESSTGLYYDTQNDLFYDQDTQMYLDIVNRINYKFILNERTNVYQLRYDSKMSRALCKRLRNYLKRSDLFEVDDKKSSSPMSILSSSLSSPKEEKKQSGQRADREEGEESASSSSSTLSGSSSSSDSDLSSEDRRRRRRKGHRHHKEASKKSKKQHRHKSSKKKNKGKKKKKHKKRNKNASSSSTSLSSSDTSNEVEMIEKSIDNDDDDTDSEEVVEMVDLANQYPPCIRAILVESTSNATHSSDNDDDDDDDENAVANAMIQLGSLFLVPYTGGLVGRSTSCIISFPRSKEIENEHAKIEYDLKKKVYLIKDMSSKMGTYLNKVKLEPEMHVEMKHGDHLNLGDSIGLLIHIHSGSNSCSSCEPGEVIARFKQEAKQRLEKEPQLSREQARKETVKIIKKKYGLKFNDFDKKVLNSESTTAYKNRAAERRSQFGIDTSHCGGGGGGEQQSQQESRASVSVPINEANVGRKMLEKMGWKQGHGLGKKEEGILEPIPTTIKLDNSGLGSGPTSQCSIDVDEKQKRKLVYIKKTQERFLKSSQL